MALRVGATPHLNLLSATFPHLSCLCLLFVPLSISTSTFHSFLPHNNSAPRLIPALLTLAFLGTIAGFSDYLAKAC